MAENEISSKRDGQLPIILIAAVVQGWALYGLHMAVKGQLWPATEPAWLLALYAIAALTPLTVQMLAGSMHLRATWALVAGLSTLILSFGWHHGAHVVDFSSERSDFAEQWFPLGFVLGVLWLLTLPFIQARIAHGRWRVPYVALFATAWNNKLVLIEAALFTGLFWLLLFLWQQLFVMLGIRFFRELFSEPLFIYPVTSLAFGVALHLIGSLDRLTQLVLEQVLNVFKWLALVAGLILVLFTVALIPKLPEMVSTGERAISAAWLLWLIAVTVLLVNAAYRDGSIERPYPRFIALALRVAIPLTVVISLTALYALNLRIERFGFTVDRVWACVVAVAACVYSVGYALAARDKQRWMESIARVNVIVALILIGVLALALTPVLSPYRISAASQFAQVLKHWPQAEANRMDNALRYLRFSSGAYGAERLQQLARIEDHPHAASIRADAKAVLAKKHRYEDGRPPSDVERLVANMIVYPQDRTLEPELLRSLKSELAKPEVQWMYSNLNAPILGVLIDMDGNGTEEFVAVGQQHATVFEKNATSWSSTVRLQSTPSAPPERVTGMEQDAIRVVRPKWSQLQVGKQTFREVALGY
ncbi:MAG: hypothetical protein ABW034_23670 [Steroidobacteraceae bacterium]